MPKVPQPSELSLREIPELEFSKMRPLPRGAFAEKARLSFAVALLDPTLFARFGSSRAINVALRALLVAADLVSPTKVVTDRHPGDRSNGKKPPNSAKRRSPTG